MSIPGKSLSFHGRQLSRATFRRTSVGGVHNATTSNVSTSDEKASTAKDQLKHDGSEGGAMARRLAQMTEESLETGGSSARTAVAEAGFDEELKKRLQERIASASISSAHPQASALVNLPSSAGRGTQDIASAAPWTGAENVADTALRMLTDAHKPLSRGSRGPASIPLPRMASQAAKKKPSSGIRLANARERSSVYSSLKDDDDGSRTPAEREQYRSEMKARFQSGARDLPATLTGLASLANERIEEAIARGQFKNIPRGRRIERDHNADSPFIDTTEYLMNKMIKKQDIVPPWIEKQQEMAAAARTFRLRLQNDWKRHAARMISAAGGSLDEKIRRAQEYAAAEIAQTASVTAHGDKTARPDDHVSQISLSGDLAAPSAPEAEVSNRATDASSSPTPLAVASLNAPPPQTRHPFRDPAWERAERTFHELSIASLNSLTRTYNLIAPQLAHKPYFNLQRELKACYAQVAPQVAAEIRQRAMAPKPTLFAAASMSTTSGLLPRLDTPPVRIYGESMKGYYGFRQFWKDLWSSKPA